MAKLGEAKLGSTQFAEPADIEISEEIDEAVRQRAEDIMKSIYPTEAGTNWDKILELILQEHKREHEVINDIVNGRFIDYADGEQLDMIGEFWQVTRNKGESDAHFRTRIKTQFPRHTSRATFDEIKKVSETLLNTYSQRITIDENHHPRFFDYDFIYEEVPDDWDTYTDSEKQQWINDNNVDNDLPTNYYDWTDAEQRDWLHDQEDQETWEQARFDIIAEEIVFHNAGVTVSEFESLIQDVKPAGVRAFANIGKQFTHRSVTDFNNGNNDAEKGYNDFDASTVDGYDPSNPTNSSPATLDGSETMLDTGGPYADEISIQYT